MRHVATSVVAGCVLASSIGAVGPASAVEPGGVASRSSPEHAAGGTLVPTKDDLSPRLHASRRLPTGVQDLLERAFDGAARRIADHSQCRELFAALELDARTALDFSIYYPANPLHETSLCRRAVAFSHVGAGPTRVCRRFSSLSEEQAVQVVIHEALHRAGLTECAADPEGRTPTEIESLVFQACGSAGENVRDRQRRRHGPPGS